MSETMYMKRVETVDESVSNVSSSSKKENKLEDTEFTGVATNNNRTRLQADFADGATYITDLGATLTQAKKLTLRDLGQHMTERMLTAMSQDKVNEMNHVNLGSPKGETNEIRNILKGLSSSSDTWYDDSNSDYKSTQISQYMNSRFGDYVSDMSKYQDFCSKSSGLMMGEANVLNPPFQFNEIDDVRSDYRRPKIGRIYSEEIYDYNMPVMYIQPGTVSINTAGIQLASRLINQQTEKYQNYLRGEGGALKWARMKFANILNSVVSTGSKLFLDLATWYKWTPNVKQYLRFVSEIIVELAAWMGVLDKPFSANDQRLLMEKLNETNAKYDSVTNANEAFDGTPYVTEGEHIANSYQTVSFNEDDSKNSYVYEQYTGYMGGRSDTTNVLSVLNILPQFKKGSHLAGVSSNNTNSDDKDSSTMGWPVAMVTIPYAIDKGASSSETFSNSTQTHPIAEQFNQQYEQANQAHLTGFPVNDLGATAAESVRNFSVDELLGSVTEWAKNKAANAASSITSKLGLSTEAGMVAAGMGRFMLPEVWSDSTFDKSYSISMKFRSPYGHRLSIFENEMVPLAFLIGLSAPRKIGIQSYTNPYYVRIYSKGLFSVNMGIITSLSITRGEDNNDRTVEGFYRTTSVSVSIKDVLPNVTMALDGGLFGISKASNSGMNNYLCMLAGIDFIERANLGNLLKKEISILKNSARKYDFFGWMGTDGGTARSNLFMNIFQGSTLGKTMTTGAIALGKSQNPFTTRTPTSYY